MNERLASINIYSLALTISVVLEMIV